MVTVPHLNKSLARSNKNPFYQGFLTGIATINLREFFIYSICNKRAKTIKVITSEVT